MQDAGAWRRLTAPGGGGHQPAMGVRQDFERLLAARKPREAIALIEGAAARGDPAALTEKATWRLYGLAGPRDLAMTHRLLEQAAALGERDAIILRAALTANGTGVAEDAVAARAMLAPLRDDPAIARQLSLSERPVSSEGWRVDRLRDAPSIVRVEGLLLAGECAYLMERALPRLQPSIIVDPRSGAPTAHPFRDSLGVNFGPADEDLAVRRINRRIAEASGTHVACGEPLYALAYDSGQQYRPHLDAIPGATNQRAWTMLLWLNDDYDGETDFPDLGLSVRGAPGDALLFANLDAAGRIDPRTRHAGLPVTRGRKWLATRWIRQAPISPFEC